MPGQLNGYTLRQGPFSKAADFIAPITKGKRNNFNFGGVMFYVTQQYLFRVFDECRSFKIVMPGNGAGKSKNQAKEASFKDARKTVKNRYAGYSVKCKGIFKPIFLENNIVLQDNTADVTMHFTS